MRVCSKSLRLLAPVVLAGLQIVSAQRAVAQDYSDLASYSCSSFLADLDESFPANRSKAIAMAAWATGYATAFQKKARADDTAIISIIDVLINVCRQQTDKHVIEAAAVALKRTKSFPTIAQVARPPQPAEEISPPAPPQSIAPIPLPPTPPLPAEQSMAKGDLTATPPLSDSATNSVDKNGFKTFANYDIFGGDYKKIANSSENTCARTCEQDGKCQAYSFDKWTKSCYLKASVGTLNLEPSSTLGIRASVATPSMSSAASRIDPVASKKISGTVFSDQSAASKERCELTCRENRKCVGFSFAQRIKTCSLFATVEAFLRDADSVSGVKTQNPRQ